MAYDLFGAQLWQNTQQNLLRGEGFLWFTVSEMDLPRGERDFGTGHTQQWEDVTKGVTLQCIGNQKERHIPGAGELS